MYRIFQIFRIILTPYKWDDVHRPPYKKRAEAIDFVSAL